MHTLCNSHYSKEKHKRRLGILRDRGPSGKSSRCMEGRQFVPDFCQ